MKKTSLYDIEKEYDAKMTPVAGWSLAKNFPGGATAEVKHTLSGCSVFDRCHTARVRVCGEDIAKKIAEYLKIDQEMTCPVTVSAKLDESDITIVAMMENDILVLADSESDINKLSAVLENAEVSDLSQQLAQLEIAGKKLVEVLADFDIPEEEIASGNTVVRRSVAEVSSIMICNNRFSVPAVTLIFTSEYAEGMWEEFVDTYPVKPAGYAAYDTLTAKSNADTSA